jgi:hypothetical protein
MERLWVTMRLLQKRNEKGRGIVEKILNHECVKNSTAMNEHLSMFDIVTGQQFAWREDFLSKQKSDTLIPMTVDPMHSSLRGHRNVVYNDFEQNDDLA